MYIIVNCYVAKSLIMLLLINPLLLLYRPVKFSLVATSIWIVQITAIYTCIHSDMTYTWTPTIMWLIHYRCTGSNCWRQKTHCWSGTVPCSLGFTQSRRKFSGSRFRHQPWFHEVLWLQQRRALDCYREWSQDGLCPRYVRVSCRMDVSYYTWLKIISPVKIDCALCILKSATMIMSIDHTVPKLAFQ